KERALDLQFRPSSTRRHQHIPLTDRFTNRTYGTYKTHRSHKSYSGDPMEKTMKMKKQDPVSRRTILKGAAAATAASTFTIVNSKSIRGSEANSMVEIGFIGCAGEGAREAKKLEGTGQGKNVGGGDYFSGQPDKAREGF